MFPLLFWQPHLSYFAQDADLELSDEELAAIAAAEAEAEAEIAKAEGETIYVTGSAIKRKEVATPSPITVVGATDIANTGVNHIGDILQDLPEQSGGLSSQSNNNAGTSLGITTVNLRALGAARTLVLLNGRRVVPGGGGAEALVDTGIIPAEMVERIEVLNDGASTIYGSDAVSGVVNIITKQNFKGISGSAYTGLAERGGGEDVKVGAIGGVRNKKGGAVVSASFNQRGEVRGGQRDWAQVARIFDFETREVRPLGSATTPGGTIISPAPDTGADVGNAAWQAVRATGPDGALFTRDPTTGNFRALEDADRFNFAPDQLLSIPQRRINAMLSADYSLHKRVQVFAEGLFNNQFVESQLAPNPLATQLEGAVVSANNAFNPFGRDFTQVNRRLLEFGNRVTTVNQNTARGVVGVRGTVPVPSLGEWDWDASANYGRTWSTTRRAGTGRIDRLQNAVGPSIDQNTCGTPGSPIAGCVPLNLFGGATLDRATGEQTGTITQEMIDYVGYTATNGGFTDQLTFQGQLAGKLFDIPGGADARVAVGGLFRREAGAFDPDVEVAAGNVWGNKSDPISGSLNTIEGFAEASVVPVTNKDWAKWLEFTAAGRVVRYNSFGTNFTWKAGGRWTVPGGLSVRGTYSTAFRAPSIANLFSGNSDSFDTAVDPCSGDIQAQSPTAIANCTADGVNGATQANTQLPTLVGGNRDLGAEQADILTAGLTYEPEYVEGLTVAVDYFRFDLREQVGRLGASLILQNCYEAEGASRNMEDCNKIERDGTGQITRINDTLTNTLGGTETDGIDLKIGYKRQIGNLGTFATRFQANYLLNYDVIQNAGFTMDADGNSVQNFRTRKGAGNSSFGVLPRFRGVFGLQWGKGGANAGSNIRYLHSLDECESDLCDTEDGSPLPNAPLRRPINVTADLFGGYTFAWDYGKTNLTAGVNNFLDQDPVIFFNASGGTAGVYDPFGRFYYMRLSHTF